MVRLTGALMVVCLTAAVSAQPVALDISGAFNFDAVGTQAELDTARAWHLAGMGDGTDYSLQAVFGATGTGEYYRGTDHWFLNMYYQRAYASDGTADTLAQTVTTPYGTYTLGAFQGSQDLAALSRGANAVRLGTQRGKSEPNDADASATVTIDLAGADQKAYSSINLLMSGSSNGDVVDRYGTLVPTKRAWTTVTARYGDGTSELVWTSPRGATFTYNDELYEIAGGIPIGSGFAEKSPDVFEPAYMAAFNTVQVATKSISMPGSGTAASPRYSSIDLGNAFMYDVAGGIAVDEAKVLTGLTIDVSNGPNQWRSGYTEGDAVNIYGLCATPAGTGPVCNPGDADDDGDVDLDDFVLLKNNFGIPSGATCAMGDFDGDGDVDLDDFVLLKNNFGATY
ncbi:MAG: hypothetical protein GX591_01660 [Planctomycetes bacterium]|nr:hypothetical protein [Planctomycetota bacterium]